VGSIAIKRGYDMPIDLNLTNEAAAPREVNFRSLGDIRRKLREVGVRPTKQRVGLTSILARDSRHTTAKTLHEAAVKSGMIVSLATVYNTLHNLTKIGLLRSMPVDGSIVFFEINSSQHHHFLVEDRNELVDIPPGVMRLEKLPTPPEGFLVTSVDVLVKLRRKEIGLTANAGRQ
jgi:Fur family iron response transcriptional regulator